jgi:serine/threonine protein kinase
VHRDIKPANIVLNEKFQAQLTDFGTAKRVFSGSTSNASRSTVSDISYISGLSTVSQTQISQTGNSNSSHEEDFDDLVGSECYISPEMVTSKKFSYASDLWALGIIIFQLLTNSLPFKGKT